MDKQLIFGQNKLLNHPDKILEWLQGGDRTIVTVELDLTNNCNNKCPKCAGWIGNKTGDELTITEARSYLQQLSEMGAKAVVFTGGGEPLLHRDFLDALIYAKELRFHIGLITNGLLLSGRNFDAVLESCDWVRVSLDAGNATMYKITHGMDEVAWDTVLCKVSKLVARKKSLSSKCIIGAAYLTGKETAEYKEMDDFVSCASKLGVDYAQFRPFHMDFTDISNTAKLLYEKYGGIVTASWQKYNRFSDIDKRPYKKCYGVNFTTTVGASGDVFICCHMRGVNKYKLGSLRTKSLREIWGSRQQVFDKINFQDCPPFCRCDEFNRLLYEISKPKQHLEFL